MAGIYIHIPYCRKVCYYCDFHFSASFKDVNVISAAIRKELELCSRQLDGEEVSTIYFGGGTPSAVDLPVIEGIIHTIYTYFRVSALPEITLEANPDDLHPTYLHNLRSSGVNRLSIGIQSFVEEDLKWMNRRHGTSKALDSIRFARQQGFFNINIDLIYGIPGLTAETWYKNLQQFFELDIPHLSAYHLTIEPKTVFGVRQKRGEKFDIREDDSVQQFEMLLNLMESHHYRHYEISNFAREGYFSQHNLGYWSNKKYLGVGPSAHSFDGISRRWNTKLHGAYVRGISKGEGWFEQEILTKDEQYNDYILTRLRTMWGISMDEISKRFGAAYLKNIESNLGKYDPYLLIEGDNIRLNNKGKFLADRIASEFFCVE